MSETEERPVHTEFNISTGEVVHTPVTDEEWAAMKQAEADAIAEAEAGAKEDEELRAAVAAHDDPVVKALAKRLGM